MAGASFRVDLDDREAQAEFARLIRAGRNLTPLFNEIGSVLEDSSRERFKTERSPDGLPWAKLSPVTVERKAEAGFLPGILKQRGDLANSIRWESGADYVDVVAGPTQYAATHQFGRLDNRFFGGPLAPIPARPFLGLSPDDRAEILDATSAYLLGGPAG